MINKCRRALEWKQPYSNCSFGEVYGAIRSQMSNGFAHLLLKKIVSDHISDEIPPQI